MATPPSTSSLDQLQRRRRIRKKLHIVSLGSSFAAGPGIQPYTNKAARRSGANYASLLCEHLNATAGPTQTQGISVIHTDLTVSGATLLTIFSEEQVSRGGVIFPAQLSSFPKPEEEKDDVDIITLTAGGNDLDYVGGVMRDTLSKYALVRAVEYLQWLIGWGQGQEEASKPLSVEEVADRFLAVLEGIRKRAPKARIYLVEYLSLFGTDTKAGCPDVPLTEEEIGRHRETAKRLSEAYRLAAELGRAKGVNVRVVNVAERSLAHAVGSQMPWVEGWVGVWGLLWEGRAPWHPNKRGMEAVARMLEQVVAEDGLLKELE